VMLTLVGGQVESVWDERSPDHRPAGVDRRSGCAADPQEQARQATEFDYVAQICEVTENTHKGARGFILPSGQAFGNPSENRLLPQTATELERPGSGGGRSLPAAAFSPV
jgi:hypothetical protein